MPVLLVVGLARRPEDSVQLPGLVHMPITERASFCHADDSYQLTPSGSSAAFLVSSEEGSPQTRPMTGMVKMKAFQHHAFNIGNGRTMSVFNVESFDYVQVEAGRGLRLSVNHRRLLSEARRSPRVLVCLSST